MPGFRNTDPEGMAWRGFVLGITALFMGALGFPWWAALFGPAAVWVWLTGFNVATGDLIVTVGLFLGLLEIGMAGYPWKLVLFTGVGLFWLMRKVGWIRVKSAYY